MRIEKDVMLQPSPSLTRSSVLLYVLSRFSVVFSTEDERVSLKIEQSSFSRGVTYLTNHISVINYSLSMLMPHYVTGSTVNTGSNLEVYKTECKGLVD